MISEAPTTNIDILSLLTLHNITPSSRENPVVIRNISITARKDGFLSPATVELQLSATRTLQISDRREYTVIENGIVVPIRAEEQALIDGAYVITERANPDPIRLVELPRHLFETEAGIDFLCQQTLSRRKFMKLCCVITVAIVVTGCGGNQNKNTTPTPTIIIDPTPTPFPEFTDLTGPEITGYRNELYLLADSCDSEAKVWENLHRAFPILISIYHLAMQENIVSKDIKLEILDEDQLFKILSDLHPTDDQKALKQHAHNIMGQGGVTGKVIINKEHELFKKNFNKNNFKYTFLFLILCIYEEVFHQDKQSSRKIPPVTITGSDWSIIGTFDQIHGFDLVDSTGYYAAFQIIEEVVAAYAARNLIFITFPNDPPITSEIIAYRDAIDYFRDTLQATPDKKAKIPLGQLAALHRNHELVNMLRILYSGLQSQMNDDTLIKFAAQDFINHN